MHTVAPNGGDSVYAIDKKLAKYVFSSRRINTSILFEGSIELLLVEVRGVLFSGCTVQRSPNKESRRRDYLTPTHLETTSSL